MILHQILSLATALVTSISRPIYDKLAAYLRHRRLEALRIRVEQGIVGRTWFPVLPALPPQPSPLDLDFAGMGFSFRFGYMDWFDFSFRVGQRNTKKKSDKNEVYIQGNHHARSVVGKGKRIDIKNDKVSLLTFVWFFQVFFDLKIPS